jgi:hypothetical protein
MSDNVYMKDGNVYAGTRRLAVKDQRGKKYVHYNGRQVNLKNIPVLPEQNDCVFDYVFNNGSVTHPCPAMDYWIYRHRLGHRISVIDYAVKFKIKKRRITTAPPPPLPSPPAGSPAISFVAPSPHCSA